MSNPEPPAVSVVISFLNEERFLPEAIESVLNQTYDGWELLLVDDGSTDRSSLLARSHAERDPSRVRYLEHPGHENRGTSASRNLGIRNCRADLIALLDGDDVWLPTKLADQVTLMARYPEVGMLYSAVENWYSWSGDPEDGTRDVRPELGIETDTILPPVRLVERMVSRTAISPWPSTMMLRRTVTEEIGGFEESFPGMYDDQVFAAKLNLASPVYVTRDVMVRYRRHADSLYAQSRARGDRDSSRVRFLEWLLVYLEDRGFRDAEVWRIAEYELNQMRGRTEDGLSRRPASGTPVTRVLRALTPGPLRIRLGAWIRSLGW